MPVLLGIILAGAAGAVAVTAATPARAAAGCRADYQVTNSWQGGFGASVTVTDLGDPVTAWQLTWTFPAGQSVTQLWNGTVSQSGAQVTVTNASYNGTIATGGTASFGFNGAWSGSNPAPASFALNGTTCTGTVPSISTSPSASPSASPPTSPGGLPCDLYAAGGTPCVAAHSTTRALLSTYNGALYQVRRASDHATRDIGVVSRGGPADAAAQDTFCAGTSCVITVLYDQSGHGNNLGYQGTGGIGGADTAAGATREAVTVGGSRVYSLYINAGNSYWRNGSASGIPTGSAPEGIYLVTSGTHVNGGCCFDYGNSETTRRADGAGAMDAIYFGTSCWFGGCSGTGPWVQADLEYGLYPGGSRTWNPHQRAFPSRFVTAMLKNNGTSRFAIKGSNAQSGALTTLWDGALPAGYSPMRKQGAIILGSGGDCCIDNTNQSAGTFYEGAIVAGYPSDATDNAVQAGIVTAGYR
ncbi:MULTISPECIES: arabinofuranosidase catalytic domain-containing protein [unclassified Actinoplanes]|uniref:arabinofuranosidase catalytic domain-containing protein n=1 Tax=unclassified Actinoplanes TaxID=2626549 RepID=UPI00043A2EC0|nr:MULTISPECIES: arabinofuranosidase catalytic domain-containing protein [unclassified Actinoplanes]